MKYRLNSYFIVWFRGGDYIKKIIWYTLIPTILLLVSCGQIPRENKSEIRPDNIIISNFNTTYYTKTEDGKLYPSSDAIVVCGYNEYKCINTNMEYDEESGKYICTVEFKKIIVNE